MKRIFGVILLLLSLKGFCQPSGYVEGTYRNWTIPTSYGNKNNGFFQAVGWDSAVDITFTFFTGDGQDGNDTTNRSHTLRKWLNDAGPNWDGIIRPPGQTPKKLRIFEITHNAGANYNIYEEIIAYMYTHVSVRTDTSDASRNWIGGLSGGCHRSIAMLSNYWGTSGSYDFAYRHVWGAGVFASSASAITAFNFANIPSYFKSYWGFGTSDGGLTPPLASYQAFSYSPGSAGSQKKLDSLVGGGHNDATWDWFLDTTWNDRWAFLLNYVTPTRCGANLQRIPVTDYMFYDLSAPGRNQYFQHSDGGAVWEHQLVRVPDDPRFGTVYPDSTHEPVWPRSTVGINRQYYQDGGLVKWIDFKGQKWYIDEVQLLDKSYYGNWFTMWWGDSSAMYNWNQIANPDTSIAQINFRTPDRNSISAWTTFTGFTDSARFIMIRVRRGNNLTTNIDSLPDIRSLVLYGCKTADSTIIWDTTFKPNLAKQKVRLRDQTGANMSYPVNDTLTEFEKYMRNYYGRTQDGSAAYLSIDTNATSINTEKINLISAPQDSSQRLRGQRNFWVLQGPVARAWKKLKDAGECGPHCNIWTPADSADVNYKDTNSYRSVSRFTTMIAARYGPTGSYNPANLIVQVPGQAIVGGNNLWGIQDGNEDNKWWFGRYESPMVYVAKSWMIHKGMVAGDPNLVHLSTGFAFNPAYVKNVIYLEKMINPLRKVYHSEFCIHYYSSTYAYKNYPIVPEDTTTIGVRVSGEYPENYGIPQANMVHDFLVREAGDSISIGWTEYGKDKAGMQYKGTMTNGGATNNGFTPYGTQQYDSYDSTMSQAIDVFRELLMYNWSRVSWSAQFAFLDYDSVNRQPDMYSTRYFFPYNSSGSWNPYNNIKFPLWWLRANFVRRFGDYVPDSVYSYVNGGACLLRAKHYQNADSVLFILFEGDTSSSNSAFNVPKLGAATPKQVTLSTNNLDITETNASTSGDNIPSNLNVMPKFFVLFRNNLVENYQLLRFPWKF